MATIIVGGGNVGFEVASRLARRDDVIVVDRRFPPWLQDAVRGGTMRYVEHDALTLRDPDDILRAASPDGRESIDTLICTVGTYSGAWSTEDPSGFESEFRLNVLGNIAPIKTFLPEMRRRGSGKIVVLSSTSGHHAPSDLTSYGPSKWALEGFCGSLWAEARRDGIAVDVISPTTLKNVRSDVFRFGAGIEASRVGAVVEHTLARPGRHRRFVPSHYRLVRVLERLAPGALDRRAGRGRGAARRSAYRARPRPRSALITGASSGLGRALALAYAPELERLHVVARGRDALDALATQILASHPTCDVRVEVLDMGDLAAVSTYAASLPEIDLLVNNAAFHVEGPIVDTPLELYERTFAANCFGPVRLTSALLKRKPPATIVNILSTTAIAGRTNLSAYASSKAGLWAFTRSLRRLYADSVHVLEVLPATFESSLFDKGIRPGQDAPARGARAQAMHTRVMTSAQVAQRVRAAEIAGREVLLVPAVEARLFLWLELLAPPLFRRLFG